MMNNSVVTAFKLILLALVIFWGLFLLRKRVSKTALAFLVIIVTTFAAAANVVVEVLPPLRDTIILTALGEKNAEAKKDEVYLTGFTVDGEDVPVESPIAGNWYWNGNRYCWRPKEDSRRPEDISDSITLTVPVGWERTINFDANEWRGIVRIEESGLTRDVDTYRPEGQGENIKVSIGRSSSSRLLLSQARTVLVYALVLISLSAAAFWFARKTAGDPDRLMAIIRKHGDEVVYAICAVTTFYLLNKMLPNGSNFNGDQMICLGVETNSQSIQEAIEYSLIGQYLEPPISYIINYVYYGIAPAGSFWLFLLPRIYISLAVFFLGKTAALCANKGTGVIAAILGMSSLSILQYGQNIRGYSLAILLVVLLIFAYMKVRIEKPTKLKETLFFAAILAVAYCNYHACILIAGLFILDLFVLRKKPGMIKRLLPYFAAGLLFLPWVIAILHGTLSTMESWEGNQATWHTQISWQFIKELVFSISGQNTVEVWMLLGSIALLLMLAVLKAAKGKLFYLWGACAFLATFFCSVLLIWAVLNPANPMLNLRYFSPVYPVSVLLEACLISFVIDQTAVILSADKRIVALTVMVLTLVTVLPGTVISAASENSNSWLKAVESAMLDSDIYYSTSCVYMRNSFWGKEKLWAVEFLFQENGRREAVNCEVLPDSEMDNILQYKRLYVFDQSEQEKQLILERGYEIESQPWPLTIYKKD